MSPTTRIDESSSTSDVQNLSEYWFQQIDVEIFVELERSNENRVESDEVSVSVVGGCDEATEIVIENPYESDKVSFLGGGGDEATEFLREHKAAAAADMENDKRRKEEL